MLKFFLLLLLSNSLFSNYKLKFYPPYYSQCGQDKFVNEKIFKNKKNGVFVEVGAHDGRSYSNTLFFEERLGWKGICIEPNPIIFQKLIKNRNCICVQCALSNFIGTQKFLLVTGYAEMLSGLVDEYDSRHPARIDSEIKKFGGSKKIVDTNVFTLNSICDTYDIKHIDFLSIDTEGSEESIIKSIDFDKLTIDVIMVEDNYNSSQVVKNYLSSKGFYFYKKVVDDNLFVRAKSGIKK